MEDRDLILLLLTVLREANHEIVVPLLARYYLISKGSDFSKETLFEFGGVVKAIAAFFILWRASRPNTAGIDDYYREIMKHGKKYTADNEEVVVPPIAICYAHELPTAKTISNLFGAILRGQEGGINRLGQGIESEEEWVRRVVAQPLYLINKPLVRIMLLLSSHDVVPQFGGQGPCVPT